MGLLRTTKDSAVHRDGAEDSPIRSFVLLSQGRRYHGPLKTVGEVFIETRCRPGNHQLAIIKRLEKRDFMGMGLERSRYNKDAVG